MSALTIDAESLGRLAAHFAPRCQVSSTGQISLRCGEDVVVTAQRLAIEGPVTIELPIGAVSISQIDVADGVATVNFTVKSP